MSVSEEQHEKGDVMAGKGSKGARSLDAKLGFPNQYHLTGGGISLAYYPNGMGPIMKGGPVCLVYQDAARVLSFTEKQIRREQSSDLGAFVSVTLNEVVDIGSTSFTLLLPDVRLPEQSGASAAIQSLGITTFHRTFLAGPGQGQQETYSTVQLAGDARIGPLPA